MTPNADPNWMTIAGLLYVLAGAFVLGKALAALGHAGLPAASPSNPTGSMRRSSPSQHGVDTTVGLALIAVGMFLQIIAQFGARGGDSSSAYVVFILLALVAVLMLYALCDGVIHDPLHAPAPAVREVTNDGPRIVPSAVHTAITASESKVTTLTPVPVARI